MFVANALVAEGVASVAAAEVAPNGAVAVAGIVAVVVMAGTCVVGTEQPVVVALSS